MISGNRSPSAQPGGEQLRYDDLCQRPWLCGHVESSRCQGSQNLGELSVVASTERRTGLGKLVLAAVHLD